MQNNGWRTVEILGEQTFDSPVMFMRSLDGGQTWSVPMRLAGPSAMGANTVVGPDGEVHVSWLDMATSRIMLRTSTDHGASFGPARVVAPLVANPTFGMAGAGSRYRLHPIIPALGYESFQVDMPRIAVDRSNGPRRGSLYVVWAEAAEGVESAWSGQFIDELEPNDTPAQATLVHIGDDFSNFTLSELSDPTPDGDYFAFDGAQGDMISMRMMHETSPPPATLERYILDWSSMYLTVDSQLDPVCAVHTAFSYRDGTAAPMLVTLPATRRYLLPAGGSGGPDSRFYLRALREFVVNPSSVARDHRDIVMVHSNDGGLTWSPKVRVNDDPPRAEQSTPEVSVDDAGRVHAAWLDRRDAALGESVQAYWTVSLDGGQTFRASRRLSSGPSNLCTTKQLNKTGDHLAIGTLDGVTHVFWPQQGADGLPYLMTTRIADLPVSIAIPRFQAEPSAGGIRVQWQVGDAAGISGFVVHRSHGAGEEYEPIANVAVRGEGGYEHMDTGVPEGETARYRLEVKRGGSSTWEGPIEATMGRPVTALAIERLGPNPFRDEAGFVLALPEDSPLKVQVYDVTGQLVREMATGGRALAGRQAFVWDGRDSRGRQVAPGVYHLRAEGARQVVTKRLVRLM